ncbi:MAG: FAA hydrolase family protein [Alphaproteobacteria bacterium]|nr:MAG: FAA hydrolase family protein [Alphaproteobacteria bacterium]
MKLVSFANGRGPTYGVVTWDGIIDIGARIGLEYPDLKAVLNAGALDRMRDLAERESPDFDPDNVRYLPPIPGPEKIFCVGVNYPNRNTEYADNSEAPRYPSLFLRTPDSFVGHNEPILRPPESGQLDYEGEIALIIGKGGRRIPEFKARDHIAGLTCANDGTLRDWVRHGKFNVTQGKNFDRSGSMGPWMTTVDEFADLDDIPLITRVNGEIRQQDTTANLIFPFARLISYISTFSTLKPGDVILTGTPTGAGARLDPPQYLSPGDVVEVQVSNVGVLTNEIRDEG